MITDPNEISIRTGAEILNEVLECESLEEVATKRGVSRQAIQAWLKNHNLAHVVARYFARKRGSTRIQIEELEDDDVLLAVDGAKSWGVAATRLGCYVGAAPLVRERFESIEPEKRAGVTRPLTREENTALQTAQRRDAVRAAVEELGREHGALAMAGRALGFTGQTLDIWIKNRPDGGISFLRDANMPQLADRWSAKIKSDTDV